MKGVAASNVNESFEAVAKGHCARFIERGQARLLQATLLSEPIPKSMLPTSRLFGILVCDR